MMGRLPDPQCPDCGEILLLEKMDRVLGQDRRPQVGDFTLCLGCAALLQFTGNVGTLGLCIADTKAIPLEVRAPMLLVQAVYRRYMMASKAAAN